MFENPHNEKGGRGSIAPIEQSPARITSERWISVAIESKTKSHSDLVKDPSRTSSTLWIEHYSWRSLSVGKPILLLHSTHSNGALLTLPMGFVLLRAVSIARDFVLHHFQSTCVEIDQHINTSIQYRSLF
jgi:hypothetical protein